MGDEESLIKWLQTFSTGRAPKSLSTLSDGVFLSTILNKIDPSWFTESWLVKIKQDTGANWRLKVSNLKKVYDRVIDAYRENYGQKVPSHLLPDVNKIGEHEDAAEIQKLIKLVLGCAVMCEKQTEHINAILEMEADHQHAIMCMIQDLNLGSEGVASGSVDSLSPVTTSLALSETATTRLQDEIKLKQAMQALDLAIEQRNMLEQKCQRMDLQIQHLQEERSSLKVRVSDLEEKVTNQDVNLEDQRCKEFKKQLDAMQEEIFKLETSRDEYRLRTELLERELNDLRVRQDELQGAANQARSLKDEVDILREAAGRLEKAEATVEGLRKKLEECSELRSQMKALEDKNTEYLHRNMGLEEEIRKSSTWKNQLEAHRKQLSELQIKLNEETKHVDKLEYEGRRLQEKLAALSLEKERLLNERDKLREVNEELELKLASVKTPTSQLDVSSTSMPSPSEVLQILPPDVKEKIVRLEHENKRLRENQFESSKIEEMELTIESLRDREQELSSENRACNQTILRLQSQVEELISQQSTTDLGKSGQDLLARLKTAEKQLNDREAHLEEFKAREAEYERRRITLEDALTRKDIEMQNMEERYKKYVEKAKEVVKKLDPKNNPNAGPEMGTLMSRLAEKDQLIANLEKELQRYKDIRMVEDQLMSTAYHNLAMQMHTTRFPIDQRHASALNTSMLNKQRQHNSTSKRPPNPQGGDYFEYGA
ncbi:protein Hook homolog 3-like isoform X2 [Artemia franciscana]|uniref:Protein hook n=1 Tax=Artemia franciscana TaxID=6661 RepID=A0AA88IAH8_ARTSF|nr:hypothetical protein QYM36_005541 [Artemia franciscana]